MNLFPLHKGLMWKEWRQNRWLFWIGLILINLYTIGDLFDLCMRYLFPYEGFVWNEYLIVRSSAFMDIYNRSSENHGLAVGLYLAVGLGGFLLSQERTMANTLDFLSALPISRREILVAKFWTGIKMIGIVLLVNFLLNEIVNLIVDPPIQWWRWAYYYVQQGSVVVAIYTGGFLVAVICGNMVSTAVGCFLVLFGPYLVGHVVKDMLRPINRSISNQNDMINIWLDHLTLPLYIIGGPKFNAWWVLPVMVVVTVVLFLLSVYLFERNAFEKNGRLFMFGRFMRLIELGAPVGFAVLAAIPRVNQPIRAVEAFLLVFGVVYLAVRLARRVYRSWGFR